jgi:large subunit ribosomal protein L10
MKDNTRAAVVEEFKEKLERAKVAVFAEYKGLTVKKMEGFRRDLRNKGAQLKVVKNTLAKRALGECNLPTCDDMLKGQIVFVLGFDDAVGGPKAATVFAKGNKEFHILGGIFEGRLIGPDVVEQLAKLPSKDVLRSRLLMLLQGPQRKLLGLLQGAQQELVGTLEALADKKGKSSPEG